VAIIPATAGRSSSSVSMASKAGSCVRYCEARGLELADLTPDQLLEISPRLSREVMGVLTVRGSMEARSAFGGTAPVRVAEQLAALRREIAAGRSWAQER
jgi:argininosuccinate lyase